MGCPESNHLLHSSFCLQCKRPASESYLSESRLLTKLGGSGSRRPSEPLCALRATLSAFLSAQLRAPDTALNFPGGRLGCLCLCVWWWSASMRGAFEPLTLLLLLSRGLGAERKLDPGSLLNLLDLGRCWDQNSAWGCQGGAFRSQLSA